MGHLLYPVPVDFSFVQEKSNDTVCYCLYTYRGEKSVGHTLSLLYIYTQVEKNMPTLFVPSIYAGEGRVYATLFLSCIIQVKK